ncbi:uncharacterized protein I303_105653 [Kwoniella dejecticola CBS 10117]|uniref:Uncharacterized protein n=1 Tax=Kwoniella dejecticola CBS 10117 TaxID=1296121 RepID=A0A1A6A013_9TREE|nr:uncharacterized protein I303_05675 [Kwoniella dejecticola CBS 10117]OBR83397.1 hypothetical protein I303_05675 [Kwoniella dejecticola CBS 10117]
MDCWVMKLNNGTLAPFECNTVNGSVNLITGQVEYTEYGYEVSKLWTYIFITAFGVGFIAQLLLGIFWRTWWTLPTLAAGTAVEVIGWGGRLWTVMSFKWDYNEGGVWFSEFNAYIIQICCLVIAPTFFSAANYILFGRIIANAGPTYTSLHSQSFSVIFVIADIACLVIQGAGGGIAGTADDSAGSDMGAYIMTGGVILQLVVTILFTILFVEWIIRRKNNNPSRKQNNPFWRFYKANRQAKKAAANNYNGQYEMSPSATLTEETPMTSQAQIKNEDNSYMSAGQGFESPAISGSKVKLMCGLIAVGTFLIIVRSVYRSVELLDGWTGKIAVNEPLFLGMDALLMCLFVFLYAIIHPGLTLGRRLF